MALISSATVGGSSARRGRSGEGDMGVEVNTPQTPKGNTVALNEYDVEINGVQTRVQLSDEDAKARGLLVEKPEAKPAAKKATPTNKAKAPANKAVG